MSSKLKNCSCKYGSCYTVHNFKDGKYITFLVGNKIKNVVPLQKGGDKRKPRKLSRGTSYLIIR